jgi:ribonuclease P/MRP protein subunit POP5
MAFEIIGERKFSKADVQKAVWQNILENLGTFGTAESGFAFVNFEEEKQQGILRCNHTNVEKVRASLCLFANINKEKACIHILNISGTLKGVI